MKLTTTNPDSDFDFGLCLEVFNDKDDNERADINSTETERSAHFICHKEIYSNYNISVNK